ncbi:ABC transporter ATP-binding protein [Sporolactobacillus pectinivorans]|uniref:ABC transporter ATP-binding protein n=1 Tax=Sporolactobacillus pectinivorans TaxID=1591408 RepID=UPI000C257E33|nr:ABC transporter ATP-binding protein [Sporolactobacillus pectinivorans]
MNFLTIKELSLTISNKRILHHLNITLEKGELVTLLGPSGCGKSTLLRAITGLLPIDDGSIVIDGQDVTHVSPKKREVGMVFQSYALFPNFSVFDNVAFGLKMKKYSKSVIRQKVIRSLDMVGLSEKSEAYPHELSGGQQQRVALARSLVVEPKILLLDEPLSALDAQIRQQLRKELRELQKRLGMTMIFVTHDQAEAMYISDRIYVMNQGAISQFGEPEHLYRHPENEFVANFIGNYNVLSKGQVKKLFGEGTLTTGCNSYALRPEAVYTEPGLKSNELAGKVSDINVLGNIVRYTFQIEDVTLYMEKINDTQNHSKVGEEKTLYVDKRDLVGLA